jgi:hypothetical protein
LLTGTLTREQLMLKNKKKINENFTALRCYHLDGEKVTFLIMPEITAGDYNVLDSG